MYEWEETAYPTEYYLRLEEEYKNSQQINREIEEKERLKRLVYSKSKYGSTKTKYVGSIVYSWFCPNCNRWVRPDHEWIHDGICETSCPRCWDTLVNCAGLEEDE